MSAPPQSENASTPAEPMLEDALGNRGGLGAWIEYLAARIGLESIGRLPRGLQDVLLGGVARLATKLDRRRSEAARSYLRQALGCELMEREGDERVVQAWRHLFRLALDSANFGRVVRPERLLERFQIDACPEFGAAIAAGRGGIFVTPHVGDFEAGSAVLPALGAKPLYVFARPPRNRPLSAHLLRTRRERGIEVLPRRGGMEHVRELSRRGAWFALLPDHRPFGRAVLAPFFGRPAQCERSVGVLALRLGVPLAFGACYLTERPFHYRVFLPRVVQPEELAGRSPEEVVTLVNAELERLILARPEQYHWLHDRYRGSPERGGVE